MSETRSDSERIASIEADLAKALALLEALAKTSARTAEEIRRQGHVGVSILAAPSRPDSA